GGRALNHVILHAIAFADTVRHVEVGFATAQADGGDEDDDGGSAIHVIVAVDEDFFPALQGGAQAIHRRHHAAHGIRRVQVIKGRSEKSLGRFGRGHSAHQQQAGQGGGNGGFGRQPLPVHSIQGTEIPAHGSVLVFLVGFVNGDAAEVVQQFDDALVAFIPLGGGLVEKQRALVGPAQLDEAGLER